ILLRGEDGTLMDWNTFGGTLTLVGTPGPRTEVQYTGDFNGDGTDDILLRGFDGTITLLQMSGGTLVAVPNVTNPGNDWNIV
ncbi:MAG: hypothetical protein ACOYOH_27280, partial [Paracraurococcus sp.]